MLQNVDLSPQEQEAAEARRIGILDALGTSLTAKRKEAVAARVASGIEAEWEGDEEFYQGYDDANRHEFVNTASKPTASGGSSEVKDKSAGSIVFPNITQPYVDAVAARVGDMLLPTYDRNFAMEATPIPDMLESVGTPPANAAPMAQQAPAAQPAMPAMPSGAMPQMPAAAAAPMPGMPGAEPAPDPAAALVEQARVQFAKMKAEAARKAKKAETRVDDWLSECQAHAEMRKVIDDAAKLGSGVIKGPVPVKRKANVWRKGEDGVSALVIVEEIKPASRRIDPWNLYPDYPACGESIHNGSFIFEFDQIAERKLEELKGLPGYIDSQIDKCIEEGPTHQNDASSRIVAGHGVSKTLYGIWYYHGNIKAEELRAAGCECDDEKTSYPAMLTMVNDRVIRASLNPLDTGEFPYDVIPWKRRPGMPWGMGLSRQLRTPQRIVVGATRRLMDNAGLASGPQIVVRRSVQPENNIWEIAPLKLWIEQDDAAGQAGDPVKAVVIPMMIAELTSIVNLGMKMAEDVTGMPMLMQGQQGKAPDTVGGMTILNNNANAVLRRIARLFDSCITEPHMRRYYAWLMEYGEDDDEKGDFQVVARGSTALVERDIQSQEMVNVLALCLNPLYGKNPKKAMDEFLKSRRFDPAAFDYTEEELKAMQEQQPAPPPQIEVAKIRAEADMAKTDKIIRKDIQIAQVENQTELQRIAKDTDRDTAFVNAETARTTAEHAAKMEELATRRELAMLDYANREKVSLDQVKAKLADTAMKLRVQKELSPGPQVATPPNEPAGKASQGKAFAQ